MSMAFALKETALKKHTDQVSNLKWSILFQAE